MLRHYIIVLVGLLSACSTVPMSHEPSSVPLTQAVHFSSPDGSDAVASPGAYRVEQTGPTVLKLIPGEEGNQHTITVQAMRTEHEAPLSGPLALSIPYTEDEHHVVLLMPGGEALDAVGTYSGVRSRAAFLPVPAQTLPPYFKLSLSLTLNPNSIMGGAPVTGIVSLQPSAPGNGVIVGLSSNSGFASVPAGLIIRGGQAQGTFPIQTAPVQNTATGGMNTITTMISASVGGQTKTAPLTISSRGSQCPTVGGAICNNHGWCDTSMQSTQTCTCDPASGYVGPACQYSNATTCNGHGTVNYVGACTCMQGFTGPYCNTPVQ